MLHWHSPREDLIGVIALIVYVITCGSLNGGRNGSILDSHTIYFLSFGAFNLQESPLRIRGKSQRHLQLRNGRRITPAHAGKSFQRLVTAGIKGDHPRACGEKVVYQRADADKPGITPAHAGKSNLVALQMTRTLGSPPRMRGKAVLLKDLVLLLRITPAHAGKRQVLHHASRPAWDHPRACGEKGKVLMIGTPTIGSPPRMRGEDVHHLRNLPKDWITPAHAGRSRCPFLCRLCSRDHPRACGEKAAG